jgi:VanZ family protein
MLKIKKIIHWGLVIAWMIIIFCFSSQTGPQSGRLSNRVAAKIVTESVKVKQIATVKRTNTVVNHRLKNNTTAQSQKTKRQRVVSRRKFATQTRDFAHCVLYFILAALFFFALKQHGISSRKVFLCTLVFCILYSLTDEWHQSFVPGRGIELNDGLLDLLGSSCGATIAWLYFLIRSKLR